MKSIRSLTTTSALRGLALAGALALPGMAQAESVNLISADGTVDIVGEFVEFTDNSYVIRTALAQGRSGQAVFRNRRKDGSVFNQLLMLEPLYDSADRLVYVVGSQFVLTPRNRAKAADEHALQVVKEIDRLLELNDRLRSSTRETLARSTAASVKLWLDN